MKDFDRHFRDAMKSPVPLLGKITQYIIRRKGKRIRPVLVFLSADVSGKVNDSTFTAATLIELLHTATLVHDDVVDDAYERRGFFSVNALWKKKVAVLVGDYLLSRGLLTALEHDEYELLRIVSDAVRAMSEGELLQIEKARRLDIAEEVYFDIIGKKTASLFAACCACGATSAGAGKDTVARLKQIGYYAGIAFQIKDDLFDYDLKGSTGKQNGIDIKEKKMTLPLIYLLNHSSFRDKRRYINIVKNHNENRKKVVGLIDCVNRSGGITYAADKMYMYKNKALDELASLPSSEARTALQQLITFVVERKK